MNCTFNKSIFALIGFFILLPLSTFPQSKEIRFEHLKVYDVLGTKVETFVNEEKVGGTYKFEFYGTGLPSGIYFYLLQIQEVTYTKKMIIMK